MFENFSKSFSSRGYNFLSEVELIDNWNKKFQDIL